MLRRKPEGCGTGDAPRRSFRRCLVGRRSGAGVVSPIAGVAAPRVAVSGTGCDASGRANVSLGGQTPASVRLREQRLQAWCFQVEASSMNGVG
jgi:hypothetical protein